MGENWIKLGVISIVAVRKLKPKCVWEGLFVFLSRQPNNDVVRVDVDELI
jgi:hypothetical protein